MVEIKEIDSKQTWEDFVNNQAPKTFLHSWNWGEFNIQSGNRIFRLGLFSNNTLTGVALIIKVVARRGSFLFCPHGPLLADKKDLGSLVEFLKKLGEAEGVAFIRFSPLEIKSEHSLQDYRDLGFRDAPIHMHSELVWMLDITPSEEELLAGMRKSTRYSVKKARNDGVEVFSSSESKDVDKFYSVYQETVDRQGFVPFSKEYIRKEFEAFSADNKALFFFGKYNNDLISSALIIFSQGSAFYHHGASVFKYPQIPATHLLQWEIIKEAKRRGCSYYNFWGIAPDNRPKHPWRGLTTFKQGFGGFSEEYLHAQDLVLSNKYWVTYVIESVRKAKRGL